MNGKKGEEENQDPFIEKKENSTEEEDSKNLNISYDTIERIKNSSYIISRKIRWVIFCLFIIINLLMNFDHGTIPAATTLLKQYLNINDSQLGFFGSLVFLGVIIGSLVSLTIINTFNRKYILLVFLILCSISLFVFTITTHYIILCIDRVIIGIFQAFISIYLPLWCEQFGIESKKTLMIALIQVAPPIGVLVGYIITSLFNMYLSWFPIFGDIPKEQRWLFSFYVQSIIIVVVSLFLLFFSDKYFNSKARRVPIEVENALNKTRNEDNEEKLRLSFFYTGSQNYEKSNTNNSNTTENLNNELYNESKNNKNKNKEIPFLTKLKLIFSEPFYILSALILSLLYFIVTCVQYWASDYMEVGLNIKDEHKRLFAFSFVCLTSPTLGLVTGGMLVDKIGGYGKKDALIICLIFSLLSCLPAIPLPFIYSYYGYAILLWVFLFLGASLIPTFQGIVISCLPKDIQGSGNSCAILLYNLLGYFPGPFVYGFLKNYFDDKNNPKKGSEVAQIATNYSTFLITILVIISTIIRFIKDKEYSEKMGRESTKNIEDLNDDDAIRQRESSLDFNNSKN